MKKKVLFLLILTLILCGCGKEKQYYCVDGELDGDECIISSSKDAYGTCRDGYIKTGYVCRERTDATVTTTCLDSDNYEPQGNLCVSIESYPREEKYSCDDVNIEGANKIKLKNDKCVVTICSEMQPDGNSCKSSTSYELDAVKTSGDCPDGTQEIYGECKKTTGARYSYSCEVGTLSGKYCILENTLGVVYTCDEGEELVGYECITKTRVPAKEKED